MTSFIARQRDYDTTLAQNVFGDAAFGPLAFANDTVATYERPEKKTFRIVSESVVVFR
jgi:hypothetical protein